MKLKEKLMNQMMDKQFGNMSSNEKQQMMENMMDRFFSGMTNEEKSEMMENMMPKMMGNMMSGNENSNSMMGMMQMMMGKKKDNISQEAGKMPWDNCMEMMTGFKETAYSAKFANDELRGLFEEWCLQIEQEILEYIKKEKSVNIEHISEKLNLTQESVKYLLNQMAAKEIIHFCI